MISGERRGHLSIERGEQVSILQSLKLCQDEKIVQGVVLSPRERAVAHCVLQGKINKLIAYDLGLTEGTVKVYITKLLAGLSLNNRNELARWVRQHESALLGHAVERTLHPSGCLCSVTFCIRERALVAQIYGVSEKAA